MIEGAVGPAAAQPEGALARNAFVLLIAQAISTTLAVVLNAALGRALGAAEFGVFILVSSMAGFAYVIAEWGQTQYVVREIAQNPLKEAKLLGTTLAARILAVSILAGVTAGTAWILGYDARTGGLAVLFVAAMLPFFLAQAISLVFRARERMEYDALAAVVDRVFTLAATLLALALGAGLVAAAAGVGVGGAMALGAAILFLRRLGVSRPSVSGSEVPLMLWGGAAIVLTNVEGSVQPYIDTILLSKLTPAESVGLYGAARTFVGTLVAPAIIVSVAAYPRLSRAAFERGLLRRELGLLMRPVLGLAVLCSVGTFLFAQQAVDLVYGSSFAPAGTILRLLAPGFLLLFVDNMLGAAVVAVGRPQPLAVAMLLKIVACAGLTLVLAPQFQASHHNGGAGLAIASVVSEVVVFVAALLILPAGSLDPALLPDLGRALTAGMGTLMLFGMLPTLPLVAGIPLCVLTFGALSVACGLVQPAELIALPRLLRQPRGERVL
jgi:O-antigen/teichoic acid export membrane protein